MQVKKYCRVFQGEHSAILSTFSKLPFVIKIFVLSIFEWSFYTGFTAYTKNGSREKFIHVPQGRLLAPLDTSAWALKGGFSTYAISMLAQLLYCVREVSFVRLLNVLIKGVCTPARWRSRTHRFI